MDIILYGKKVLKLVEGEKFYIIFFVDGTCKCVDTKSFDAENYHYFRKLATNIVKVYEKKYKSFYSYRNYFCIFNDGTCFVTSSDVLLVAFNGVSSLRSRCVGNYCMAWEIIK